MSHDWSCHVFLFFWGWTIAGYQLFNHIFILFKTNAMSDSVPRKKENCFEASIWNLEKHLKVGFHFLQKHHNNKDDVRPLMSVNVCDGFGTCFFFQLPPWLSLVLRCKIWTPTKPTQNWKQLDKWLTNVDFVFLPFSIPKSHTQGRLHLFLSPCFSLRQSDCASCRQRKFTNPSMTWSLEAVSLGFSSSHPQLTR